MKKFGADLAAELNARVIDSASKVDAIPDSNEKTLTLTIDFPSTDEFFKFSNSKNFDDRMQNWLLYQIHNRDKDSEKSAVLKDITIRTSVVNSKSVCVIIARYTV